jgi:hypothetical protein
VQTLSLVILTLAGLWLAAVGFLMALRPRYCLHLFEKMTNNLHAANWRLNLTEQGLRLVAAAALIIRSPVSKAPLFFEIAGWALLVSSLAILAAPIRWHAEYGFWWSRRLTPGAIRLLSPVPAVAGAALIYGAF